MRTGLSAADRGDGTLRHVFIPINANPSELRSSGTVRYSLQLAHELDRHGHAVTILATGRSGNWNDIKVLNVTPTSVGELAFARHLRRFTGALTTTSDDVVVASGEHYADPFVSRGSRCAVIMVAHGPVPKYVRRRRPLVGWYLQNVIEPRVASRSSYIVAIDEEAFAYYRGRYPSATCVRLGVGVDTVTFVPGDPKAARAKLGLPPSGDFILVVGRSAKEKRLELAGEAFLTGSARHSNLHLALAGSSPEDAFTKSLLQRFPSDKFHPLFVLKHEEMPCAYQACDVLLISSSEEQLPTVALEALACGVPVVSTPVGDMPGLVRLASASRIANPTDVSLAEASLDVIAEAKRHRERVTGECRELAEKYSWTSIGAKMSDLVEKA